METVLLALLSCAAALLLAAWGGMALRKTLFPDIAWHGFPLDARVALFTLVVALGAGLVTGLPTALRAGRMGLVPALKVGPREGMNPRGSRTRATLVALQAGLCMVLLVAAGAFIKSLNTVTRIDVGFDVDRLAVVTAAFADREEHDPQLKAMMPLVIERLRSLPQVEAVAEANWRPLREHANAVAMFDGQGREFAFRAQPPSYQYVSPNFFSVMGMQLVAGRVFTEEEREPTTPHIVINGAMAAALWPGRSPLGQCVRESAATAACARVIGVVETAHRDRLIEPEPTPHYYRSLRQLKNPIPRYAIVRAAPEHLARVMTVAREQIRQDLSGGAYPDVQSLADDFAPELRPWRLGAALFSAFGALALIVAVVGMYSVVTYIVQQRTHEIGVRMALGADTYDVAGMVMRDAGRMVGAGLIVGVVAAFALGSLLEALLFETSARDPAIIGTVSVLLLAAGALAALAPAWRAIRVNPTQALRCE
jgi:predicted permease